MAVLHICPGPTVELRRDPVGAEWCFRCRRRTSHTAVLLGDAEPSYYEPVWSVRCSRCGEDHTAFPGGS